jgi:hypothetical protein
VAGSPQHATLAAGVVATLVFDKDFDRVEVLNVDGTAEVYFTVDGTTPAVGATGTQVLPAVITNLEVEPPSNANTVVKLLSLGTPKVSVRGI